MPTIDQVWRDYNTDGVPGSGDHEPVKSEIRDVLNDIQDIPSVRFDAQTLDSGERAQARDNIDAVGLTGNETVAGTKVFQNGVIASGAATGALGHTDSQLESRNDGGGHALVSIVNVINPGDITEEAGVTLVAYNDAGGIRQMASLSAQWANNASVATGYGIMRLNVSNPDTSGGIVQRLTSHKGITFFGTSETDFPGARQVKFRRNGASLAHIVGDGDLILDGAASGGAASVVFLNGQNAGNVQLASGGGTTFVENGTGSSSAPTSLRVGSKSGRSINAAGTINASGADYAEYMTKAEGCGDIPKGAVVGINSEGLITDKWADAIHFMVKSTKPSYVGGDVWGIGDEPPPKPDLCLEPFFLAEPPPPADGDPDDRKKEHSLAMIEYRAVKAAHEAGNDQATQVYNDITLPAWEAACAEYAAKVEALRQSVDRIAFSGQVPVNVTDAKPGDYIVPVKVGKGIGGIAIPVSEMTFEQSLQAVGKVIAIEADGRPRIVVKAA